MLLNFRVANFRSINEMVVLSMVPSDIKNQMNVIHRTNPNATKNKEYYGLTSAAIYGANASGKSNVIKALFEFVSFITFSSDNKPNDLIKMYIPFKLNSDNLKRPSSFSIDFILNGIFYSYEISVFENKIIDEILTYQPKGKDVKIFNRKEQEIARGNGFEGVFELVKQRTNENQLFLGKLALENVQFAKEVYEFIRTIFVFTTEIFHSNDFNKTFNSKVLGSISKDLTVFNLSKSLVNKIDTQVVDYLHDGEKIRTFHLNNNKENIEFEFDEESSGTQRIISFIPLLLFAIKYGLIVVVDEFERSLHPDIAQYILSLFNDVEVNKKGAQFIFATHDTTLLSPENKLRRDQINLVEKNDKGETELYSLTDIKGIREGNYEKWYLEGRLGGVPNIARETFRHELIEFINS